MAMSFSENALNQLFADFNTISGRQAELFQAFMERQYKDAKTREYAHQGFMRRLNTLVRCINKIFEILPPDRDNDPSREQLWDAQIYLQAFVFNLFGIIDNLAWILVNEKDLKQKNGKAFSYSQVGLGRSAKEVRKSLSSEFRKYLESRDGWFAHLENYRHALGHRIPLYIPPGIITDSNEPAHKEFGEQANSALASGDYAEYHRLIAQQETLLVFRPLMMHSFEENAQSIYFHPQILVDFNTVREFAWKVIEELDR